MTLENQYELFKSSNETTFTFDEWLKYHSDKLRSIKDEWLKYHSDKIQDIKLPNVQKYVFNTDTCDVEIGTLLNVPKGTYVWCINLQEQISFEKDKIVKVTNRIIGSSDYLYGIIQQIDPRDLYCERLIDSSIEIGFSYKNTEIYEKRSKKDI